MLQNPVLTTVAPGNAIPDTLSATSGTLAATGEALENRLVRLARVEIVSGTWPAPGQDGTLQVDDGSGPATLEVLRQTDLDETGSPLGRFDVVGIVVQSDTTQPYSSGYRLRPRGAGSPTLGIEPCAATLKRSCSVALCFLG